MARRAFHLLEYAVIIIYMMFFILFTIGKCWSALAAVLRDILPLGSYFLLLSIASFVLMFVMLFVILTLYYLSFVLLFEHQESLQKAINFLSLLIVVTISAALLAHMSPDFMRSEWMLKKGVDEYRKGRSDTTEVEIDTIQQQLNCCGVWFYWDWDANVDYECKPQTSNCRLPLSCRRNTQELSDDTFYTVGCQWKLLTLFIDSRRDLLRIAFTLTVIEVIFRMTIFYMLTYIRTIQRLPQQGPGTRL